MKLFLDDIRKPIDVLLYIKNDIYKEEWCVVRNYRQFTEYILNNPMPNLISFDHDLADEHYTPKEYWDDYQLSKQYQESQNYQEKTGMDCALFLIDYCIENRLNLPKFLCHSMNPVGKDKILGVLNGFNKK